jgi:hypothetical protein
MKKDKILQLHLHDPVATQDYTFLCSLVNQEITYMAWEGHSSFGKRCGITRFMPKGTYLPLSKSREDQTLSDFKQELTDLINEKSYAYIVREVVPVEFDEL